MKLSKTLISKLKEIKDNLRDNSDFSNQDIDSLFEMFLEKCLEKYDVNQEDDFIMYFNELLMTHFNISDETNYNSDGLFESVKFLSRSVHSFSQEVKKFPLLAEEVASSLT